MAAFVHQCPLYSRVAAPRGSPSPTPPSHLQPLPPPSPGKRKKKKKKDRERELAPVSGPTPPQRSYVAPMQPPPSPQPSSGSSQQHPSSPRGRELSPVSTRGSSALSSLSRPSENAQYTTQHNYMGGGLVGQRPPNLKSAKKPVYSEQNNRSEISSRMHVPGFYVFQYL